MDARKKKHRIQKGQISFNTISPFLVFPLLGLPIFDMFAVKLNIMYYSPDKVLDLRRLNKYRMVVDVRIVDDSFHNVMTVENVAMCSMLAFVVVVAYAVAPDLAYQHSNRVNIDASIRCQFVVMDGFLFRRHFELVPISAVYPMDHADPDEVTEIECRCSLQIHMSIHIFF